MATTKVFNSQKYGKVTVTVKRTSTMDRLDSMQFKCDKVLTEEEALIVQAAMNYHPNGYGHHNFNGNSWRCWSSCD